jgi:orotidine-5'-phosphate decarboxylase
MGDDSIEPYFEYFAKGKGAYLLCRTSNAGAQDFLMQKMGDGRPLYKKIAEKTVEWDSSGSLGLVVGGTNISDLEEIFTMLAGAKKAIPLLIPGIGAQGGSAGRVANALAKHKMLAPLARVNASSSISYAFKKAETNDYLQAALDEMKSLNKEMKIEL